MAFTTINLLKSNCNQFLATVLCNLSMMAACAAMAWLEPFTVLMTKEDSEFKMTPSQVSWISAFVEIGELLSGIPSGMLSDKWGRKTLILAIGPIALASWIMIAITNDLAIMFLSRFLQGIVLGISMSVVPTYVAEIASANIRGALGAYTSVFTYLGFLYTFIASYQLDFNYYIYVQSILPIIFFLTFIFMPETPYYYLMKKKNEEAEKSLKWFRGNVDISVEFKEIQNSVDEDLKQKGNLKDLISTKNDRKALFIVQIVNMAAFATGVQTIVLYGNEIFLTTPLLFVNSSQLIIIVGIVLCITSFLASFVADTIGRRKLLIISTHGITISNLFISIYYYLSEIIKINFAKITWLMYLAIFSLCTFTNIGVGELIHTMQAEYFPSHTRGIAGGVTSFVAAISIFTVIKLYQPISVIFGVYMNFCIYSLLSFIFSILITMYAKESACKTLSEINHELRDN